MSIITKKLTEEELNEVKQIRQDYTNLVYALGEVELQQISINKEKQRLLEVQSSLLEKEVQIANKLQEKYGQGNLDIETGEIKP
jgi:hypothetical protein